MKVYRITAVRADDSRQFQTDLTGYSAKLLSRRDFEAKAISGRYSGVTLARAAKGPDGAVGDFETLAATD